MVVQSHASSSVDQPEVMVYGSLGFVQFHCPIQEVYNTILNDTAMRGTPKAYTVTSLRKRWLRGTVYHPTERDTAETPTSPSWRWMPAS